MSALTPFGQFEILEIEKIAARRSIINGTEYLIKWKNQSEDKNSWEPLRKLIEDKADEAIIHFESQYIDTPPKDVINFLMAIKQSPLKIKQDKERVKSVVQADIEMEEDWMKDIGSLPKDSIRKIVKLDKNYSDAQMYAEVEWDVRKSTGFIPSNSLVKTSQLRNYCPSLYIDFLESKMYTDKQIIK